MKTYSVKLQRNVVQEVVRTIKARNQNDAEDKAEELLDEVDFNTGETDTTEHVASVDETDD